MVVVCNLVDQLIDSLIISALNWTLLFSWRVILTLINFLCLTQLICTVLILQMCLCMNCLKTVIKLRVGRLVAVRKPSVEATLQQLALNSAALSVMSCLTSKAAVMTLF